MKKYFHKIHSYVSLFFLPAALLYALTGALYIFGIDEKSGSETATYRATAPKMLEKDEMGAFLLDFLRQNDLQIPRDTALREGKGGGARGGVIMGGIAYSVSIRALESGDFEKSAFGKNISGGGESSGGGASVGAHSESGVGGGGAHSENALGSGESSAAIFGKNANGGGTFSGGGVSGGAYEITTTKRGIWGVLVLLHKAKGGAAFNALAVGFSVALVVLYFSGLVITSFCRPMRKNALLVLAAGLFATIFLGYLSV